jgi:RNA polymerase-binding transcription factor DksA
VDLQDVRTQLEQMLRELDSATTTLENEHAGESEELSHFDQHPADTATELSDADREVALLEAADDQRIQVVAALQRLDDGTYGRCVDCGREIPEARLEVRPEAARCIEDQEKHEAAQA